jgi:hypothetical protein
MNALGRITVVALGLAVAGCGGRTEIAFQGEVYRARAAQADPREAFTVSVRPVEAGLEGAVLAGAHEGKRYCIENFGSSRIVWEIGPETDPAALPLEGSTLTLQGVCEPW